MARQWYCRILDQDLGPMPFAELKELAQSGTLSDDDLVRPAEGATWQRAETVVGLFRSAKKEEANEGPSAPAAPLPAMTESAIEAGGDSTAIERSSSRGARPGRGRLGAVRLGPRTGLVVMILGLVVLFGGWRGWSSYAESRRFPLPYSERVRQQGAGYTFLGWGPLSQGEYALLWGDAIAVAGGVSWGLLRWARAGDR